MIMNLPAVSTSPVRIPVINAPVRVAIILHTNDFTNTLFLEYSMILGPQSGYSPFGIKECVSGNNRK